LACSFAAFGIPIRKTVKNTFLIAGPLVQSMEKLEFAVF